MMLTHWARLLQTARPRPPAAAQRHQRFHAKGGRPLPSWMSWPVSFLGRGSRCLRAWCCKVPIDNASAGRMMESQRKVRADETCSETRVLRACPSLSRMSSSQQRKYVLENSFIKTPWSHVSERGTAARPNDDLSVSRVLVRYLCAARTARAPPGFLRVAEAILSEEEASRRGRRVASVAPHARVAREDERGHRSHSDPARARGWMQSVSDSVWPLSLCSLVAGSDVRIVLVGFWSIHEYRPFIPIGWLRVAMAD